MTLLFFIYSIVVSLILFSDKTISSICKIKAISSSSSSFNLFAGIGEHDIDLSDLFELNEFDS